MKKSFIAIIALLTVGVLSAQSKQDLKKEFLNLEKKMNEISQKYDAKFQALEKNTIQGEEKMDDNSFNEEEFGDEDYKSFGKKESFEDKLKDFVQMQDEINEKFNEKDIKEDDFFKGGENPKEMKISAQEKEYLKLSKEFEEKTFQIEKKMYQIAKKYLAKK